MTASDKFTAIQEIMDLQKLIESTEDDWLKAYLAGDEEKAAELDKNVSHLLSKRNGMVDIIRALGGKIERHDYILVELNGDRKQKTNWYFV